MATESTNRYKLRLLEAYFNPASPPVIKFYLMATSYTPDRDAQNVFADISANILADGFGLTNGIVLANPVFTESDASDIATVQWDNIQLTASGGSIGPSRYGTIINDTIGEKTLIGIYDFGSNQTATDGQNFNINNIIVRVDHVLT